MERRLIRTAPLENWPVACFELEWASNNAPACTAINRQARELLAISPDDPTPAPLEHLGRLLSAEHQASLQACWQQARDQEDKLSWEGPCLANAPARWIQLKAMPHEGRWRCVLEDITDLKQQLLAAESDLAQTALNITEAIPVGTYTMVLEPGAELASFRFMSERFLQLTGLDRDAALSDPLKAFACVHPDDYDTWLQLNAAAFTNKTRFFGETRLIVNGEVRWITAESIPRQLDDGSTVWEGVLIDVTDRILAQQKLQKNQKNLQKILNNLPISICLVTFDNPAGTTRQKARISFINDTFERTFGYAHAEIPTQEDWEIRAFPDPDYRRVIFDQWDQAMAQAMAQRGTIGQTEYRVQTKDGRTLEVLINAAGLDDGAVIALIDVTQMRRAERQLLDAIQRERDKEEQLRRTAEEKLRVSLSASAVAHEIRQPLSAILIKSRMALKQMEQAQANTEALRQLITPLAEEAQQMAAITDRISLLLRNVETDLQALDLRPLIQGALLPLRSTLRNAAIAAHCQLPETACMLRGDAIQLQLAIANLVRNSIEALQQARTPSPQLKLTLDQPHPWLELRVSDNGPGFSNSEELLQPLNSSKDKGSGIGLYVVSLTMENHGGNIQLGRSTELGGAEVTLRLPALAEVAL